MPREEASTHEQGVEEGEVQGSAWQVDGDSDLTREEDPAASAPATTLLIQEVMLYGTLSHMGPAEKRTGYWR